jgi:AAA lid domain
LTGTRPVRGAASVVSCPRRFLPDKAIDLIDEAGSRVRLRHAQLPEEARDLDKELRALLKEKEASVRCAVLLCVLCLNMSCARCSRRRRPPCGEQFGFVRCA